MSSEREVREWSQEEREAEAQRIEQNFLEGVFYAREAYALPARIRNGSATLREISEIERGMCKSERP